MHRTNPDSLRSCLCFRVFRLNFASDLLDLLLVRIHQAEIIVVKHLIQGRNNEAWWELNLQPCNRGRRKNDAPKSPNHSAMLPTSQSPFIRSIPLFVEVFAQYNSIKTAINPHPNTSQKSKCIHLWSTFLESDILTDTFRTPYHETDWAGLLLLLLAGTAYEVSTYPHQFYKFRSDSHSCKRPHHGVVNCYFTDQSRFGRKILIQSRYCAEVRNE